MKIKLWKAMLNSAVIAVGGLWFTTDTSEIIIDLIFAAIGILMMGSGVKLMIEDIEYEN
jgi:hypothetical protein